MIEPQAFFSKPVVIEIAQEESVDARSKRIRYIQGTISIVIKLVGPRNYRAGNMNQTTRRIFWGLDLAATSGLAAWQWRRKSEPVYPETQTGNALLPPEKQKEQKKGGAFQSC